MRQGKERRGSVPPCAIDPSRSPAALGGRLAPGHPLPKDSPLRDGLRGHQVDVRQVPGDPDPSGEQPQVHQQVPKGETGSTGSRPRCPSHSLSRSRTCGSRCGR